MRILLPEPGYSEGSTAELLAGCGRQRRARPGEHRTAPAVGAWLERSAAVAQAGGQTVDRQVDAALGADVCLAGPITAQSSTWT